eukprot:SAG31_NODE_43_length_31224_cov_10.112578_8_plen_95_part_00
MAQARHTIASTSWSILAGFRRRKSYTKPTSQISCAYVVKKMSIAVRNFTIIVRISKLQLHLHPKSDHAVETLLSMQKKGLHTGNQEHVFALSIM